MMQTFFKRKTRSDIVFDICLAILCLVVFLIVAYPMYFIIIASVSDSNLVNQGLITLLPKNIGFYGFTKVFSDSRIWIGYRNTLIYSLVGTLVNLVITLPVAFALSRKEFKPRRILMLFFTFTMFFNGGLIPTYLLYKQMGLIDSMWVFIIPGALNVYNMIIARSFFESSIPNSLYEAAELDGCTYFQFFFKIALPLSKAVISVIGLYYLVGHWNDFFTGLIYIRDYNKQPLQIVLRDILLANATDNSGVGTGYAQAFADQIKYAVIIVSTLPVLIIYPFLQKYFEKGVMIGSMKG
ncbi:carbohydrate ABC transporter permease [Schleiferilactobacillus harbinensis]|jgi:putative aldouronate transport system permease protein|uniref:carbohydrate ABC transporter permease n=1 Tax=Schleiferilactobacillus harbinensis TaxID=304207 RepID=UPI00242C4F12|nr:carbohydrate ABC transporter permease [Schleiferilactobacillus harbinensis]MCI1688337.1 carbohydrate ABC transporter permease [Schleiferilactobacillus harbinensis]MCI1783849.1 carbohydrate ABC transporter permease [Schleiferilactobacillus harbinensis]MCI1851276.1 carbohydrate ABC transporter permease [Schleiferilactobacillus harbinensis]